MNTLGRTAEALARRGVEADLLDGAAARIEEPHLAADAAGGLLIRAHGFVAVNDLTRAVAAAARRHGARLVEQSRVRRISRRERRYRRRHRSRVASRRRGRARGRELVRRDCNRGRGRRRSGAAGAGPVAVSRVERFADAANAVGATLLHGALGRRHRAGRSDERGRRIRRAGHGRRCARSARGRVRNHTAGADCVIRRRPGRAAPRHAPTACR